MGSERLAASFVVAARWRGFRPAQTRDIAVQAVASYRESMRKPAETGVLEAWYSRITFDDVLALAGKDAAMVALVRKRVADAREQTHEHVLHKLTEPVRGLPRIVDQPPLLVHHKEVTERVLAAFFKRHRKTVPEERRLLFDRFTLVDAALKVVGVGSVGTRCYAVLFLGSPDDPMFLQVKEARRSVLEQFTGRARVKHNGQRVVVGQRLRQSCRSSRRLCCRDFPWC